MTLGDKLAKDLKKLRVDARMSQDAVAEGLGISRATLNRWEVHGAGSVTVDELERIGRLFGAQPSALLAGESLPTSVPPASLPALLKVATLLPALDDHQVKLFIETLERTAAENVKLPVDISDKREKRR